MKLTVDVSCENFSDHVALLAACLSTDVTKPYCERTDSGGVISWAAGETAPNNKKLSCRDGSCH